jgi:homoserine trans-succinylase
LVFFPEKIVVEALQNTWQSSATCVYRNWLQYMLSKKAEASPFVVMAESFAQVQRKRSAVS